MSDYEAFVHELIGYIFKVQDKDDDNLSAEIICRKLYKYGLIENVNHEWRMKYRPKHRWPATVHNGRADKEDWQSYTIDRKIENSSEKPNNCETCKYHDKYGCEYPCDECEGCDKWEQTEPTISKMEQIDKDINVRSKDEPQLTPNYCGTCKHREVSCGDLPCDVCHGYSNYEPKDEPQTETEIAKAIVHKMIDDAVIAEDAYPDLRQKMHDAVDEYESQTDCAWSKCDD